MDTSHPPPTPRFPPRAIPAGQISEPYTNAELRLIHYVNSVVRGSDEPGIELAEAVERLRFDAAYYTFRDRERAKAELDERCDPKDGPKPLAPVAPADPGLPPCKGQPLSSEVRGDLEANCCTCGGREDLDIDDNPIEYCGECGERMTVVRPGRRQCDNDNCPSNQCFAQG